MTYKKVSENDHVSVYAARAGRFSEGGLPVHIVMHSSRSYGDEAKFAMACVERWGMVAGMPDGEDSSGRAKLRLATPDELVNRACDLAARLSDEFSQRGWIGAVPSIEDLHEALKDVEDRND